MDIIQKKLDSVQFDHTVWMNELLFALNETNLYRRRIIYLIEQSGGKSKNSELSEMLIEFNAASSSIYGLQNLIKAHLVSMKSKISANGHLDSLVNDVHHTTSAKMKANMKLLQDLKSKFESFAAGSMS